MNYEGTIVERLLHRPSRYSLAHNHNGSDYRLSLVEDRHTIRYLLQSEDGRKLSGNRKVEIEEDDAVFEAELTWIGGVPLYSPVDYPDDIYPVRRNQVVRPR